MIDHVTPRDGILPPSKGEPSPIRHSEGASPRTNWAYLHLGSFGLCVLIGMLFAFCAQAMGAHGEHPGLGLAGLRCRQLHAAMLLYLCVIPGVPVALSDMLIPKLLGRAYGQFKRLPAASLLTYWSAALIIIAAVLTGGIDAGVSYFAVYSRRGHLAALAIAVGVLLIGITCALKGLQSIFAVRSYLAKRSHASHVPGLAYILCIAGVVQLGLLPAQCLTIGMMVAERYTRHAFFDPNRGGDAILLRRLSWFYLHPMLVVAALPAIGLVWHVYGHFSRRRTADSRLVHLAAVAAVMCLFTWGENLACAAQSPLVTVLAMVFGSLTVVLLGLQLAQALALARDVPNADYLTITLCAGAAILLALGICTGLVSSLPAVGQSMHATDFVASHVHVFGSAICIPCVLVGVHFASQCRATQRQPRSTAAAVLWRCYNSLPDCDLRH